MPVFGSITTATQVWNGPVSSGDSFLPVVGVIQASAASVAHASVTVAYTSGNTGTARITLFSSQGSGAMSADTRWDQTGLMAYSLVSSTASNQVSFSVSGVYAWRIGFQNSSASTLNVDLAYRIE